MLKQTKPEPEPEPELKQDTKDDETDAHYVFISDSLPSKKLSKQFQNLTVFSAEQFANRSTDDLVALGSSDLWVDISNDDARKWLQKYLPQNTHKVITLYSDKRAKWIEDVKPFSSTSCKRSLIEQIESVSIGEVGSILQAGLLRIHSSPSMLARILSCGGNIEKKK